MSLLCNLLPIARLGVAFGVQAIRVIFAFTEMDFATAAAEVQTLPYCSDDDKLYLYGLYKQATVGDVNTAKPGMLDVKGKAKWEAWNGRKG
ncbi:acyl coenzyme A binding protein [Echinococcus multilocularis]|uniref:Acyl coenzyme A binding protein n=1 Tax=Echinococcus multilocularis TaxID=6211 RepID=A0A068Y6J9_ECHMU|nr:acyl coenzyme A binding protein [Echinococcus multilocularis]